MSEIGINSALSAARAAEAVMQAIANDVSNKNTPGYKASEVHTTDLFYTSLGKPTQTSDEGSSYSPQVQIGHGSKIISTNRLMNQGAPKQTNRALDVMINGSGYFAIRLPNGSQGYTRGGSFRTNQDGVLTAETGEPILGEGGTEIAIPRDQITDISKLTISPSGQITIGDKPLGKIAVWGFNDEQALEAQGNNIFTANEASGMAQELETGQQGAASIIQKSLESSNVDSIKLMMGLLQAQNIYQIALRIVDILHRNESKANEILQVG